MLLEDEAALAGQGCFKAKTNQRDRFEACGKRDGKGGTMKNLLHMLRSLLRQQQEDVQTYMEASFPRTGRTLPGQT